MEAAVLNFNNLHKEYTGQNFVKKSGFEAVVDSLKLNFIMPNYNRLAQEWARNPDDPHLEQALIEHEREIERLRDHAPKVWSDDYVKMGGWNDIGQAFRSVFTTAAENAGQIVEGAALAGLSATGVGALAGAAKLSATASRLLVAGASRATIGVNTYHSTWGMKYREMTNSGFPKDLALSFAKRDAIWEGAIEGALGGIEAVGGKAIASSIIPEAFNKASAKYFISGRLSNEVRAALGFLREGGEEFSEEFLQTLSSAGVHNQAVDELDKQRERRYQEIETQLQEISEPYRQEVYRELESEIRENYPDIDKREIEGVLQEAWEAGIGAFWTSVLFGGVPIAVQYKNDKRSAAIIAEIAKEAPNAAAMRDQIEASGIEVPVEGFNDMKPEQQKEILDSVYKAQQERLTPEQREAKQKATEDAETIAEVKTFNHDRTWTNPETGKPEIDEATGDYKTEERNLWRGKETGMDARDHRTQNEDGTTSGTFQILNQGRRYRHDGTQYAEQDSEIKYTISEANETVTDQEGNERVEKRQLVTVDSFTIEDGFTNEALTRSEIWAEFTGQFDNKTKFELNFNHAQNSTIKQSLIDMNPTGNDLNYSGVSTDAQRLAQKIYPHARSYASKAEIGIASEIAMMLKRPGESVDQYFNSFEFTSDPNQHHDRQAAAQISSSGTKGATWKDIFEEGKKYIYLSKNSSDPSTIAHEFVHNAEGRFTAAERRIAARALNGYKLSKHTNIGGVDYIGQAITFDPNSTNWTDLQREALADAFENYLANGTLPDQQLKPLFEKIKEFMKRIYNEITQWTELTPEVNKFFDSLMTGELYDQAQAQETDQDRRIDEARARREKARNAIINDPNATDEAKADAVLDAAGEVFMQVKEEIREQEKQNYTAKINEYKEGKLNPHTMITIGEAPDAYVRHGIQNFKIKLTGKVIKKAVEDHHVTMETIENLHELINSPVALMRSLTQDNAYITIIDAVGTNGYPVIVAQNPTREKILNITSIHDRDNIDSLVKRTIEQGKFIAADNNKATKYLRPLELQLLQDSVFDDLSQVSSNSSQMSSGNTLFQTGWHGSSAHFTRFDFRHMGEGEGNQVYGWGGYVTSKKSIADSYRHDFTKNTQFFIDGKQIKDETAEQHLFTYTAAADSTLDEHIKSLEKQLTEAKDDEKDTIKKEIKLAKSLKNKKVETKRGQVYKVEIPEDNEMLNWDKELKSQKEIFAKIRAQAVKDDIDDVLNYRGDGHYFYREELAKMLGSEKEASAFLNRAGIPGIKYLGEFRRTGGKGAANYVIFDDSELSITQTLFQTAYHGSPYRFDRFDSSHMGSGEGAQAYGWGHYFASKKEIAEWYYEELSNTTLSLDEMWDESQERILALVKDSGLSKYINKNTDLKWEELLTYIKDTGENADLTGLFNTLKSWTGSEEKVLELFKKHDLHYKPGQVYEVDIPGDEEMLDWDKPLKEQNSVIKDSLKRFLKDNQAESILDMGENTKGQWIYEGSVRVISNNLNISLNEAAKYTSLKLNEYGIKGIRYLDGSSRGKGKDSHNYVIFHDNEIEIIQTLFQMSDVEMMKEAATFDNGKQFRAFLEKEVMKSEDGEYPQAFYDAIKSGVIDSEEAIDAWCEEIVRKSKQAVDSRLNSYQGAMLENDTPQDYDRDFLDSIHEEGELENFIETAAMTRNAQNYTQEDDGLDEQRELIRTQLKDQDWQAAMNTVDQSGRLRKPLTNRQREKLLTLIDRAPRDYRAIYAKIMDKPYLEVTNEQSTAEQMKLDMREDDPRREGLENTTPEKRRKIAADIRQENYARKVDDGTAQIDDPEHKEYLKRLRDKAAAAEAALEEMEAEIQDNNVHIERQILSEVENKFEEILKLREQINKTNDSIERALRVGERDAEYTQMRLQQAVTGTARTKYDNLVRDLEALIRTQQLEINVHEILANEKLKEATRAAKEGTKENYQAKLDALTAEFTDFKKSVKSESSLALKLARKTTAADLRAHIKEINDQRNAAKAVTKAKKGQLRRTFRAITPEINAPQQQDLALVQNFVYPIIEKGKNKADRQAIEEYLKPVFSLWKTDEQLRKNTYREIRHPATRVKVKRLMDKEKFEDLTNDEQRYLARIFIPENWIEELQLDRLAARRSKIPITEDQEKRLSELLPADIIQRIKDKPWGDWTLNESEQLAKIVDNITIHGKNLYKAHKEAERRRIKQWKEDLNNEIKDMPEKYKIQGAEGTEEYNTNKKKMARKPSQLHYIMRNMFRNARVLDGDREDGKHMAFLVKARADAKDSELRNMDKRTEPVMKLLKDLGIKIEDLWKKTDAIDMGDHIGHNHQFSIIELLGFIAATKNPYSYHAVLYGNMLHEAERKPFQNKDKNLLEYDVMLLTAGERFARVEAAANKLVADNPKYQKIIDAIEADWKANTPRMNNALISYNNTFLAEQSNYFAMIRNETVSTGQADSQTLHEMMGKTNAEFNLYVERGMTKERTEIPPEFQRGIQLDLLAVWQKSVTRDEHFIAFGQWVKDANQIYGEKRGELYYNIQTRFGSEMTKEINNYIKEQAVPDDQKAEDKITDILKVVRGSYAVAMLGGRIASINTQLITSPFPFFTYVSPALYTGYYAKFMKQQLNNKMWEEICEKSPMMKHRNATLIIDQMKAYARENHDSILEAALAKISSTSMKGLEWADRVSVAPGWYALYKTEQKRLQKESKGGILNEEDISVKAAKYADTIVSNIQPGSDKAHTSGMFKNNHPIVNMVLQFQQALNVSWQMLAYDMPYHWRNGRKDLAIRYIISTAMLGVLFGVVRYGFDDDDDEGDIARKTAYYATSQFLEYMPIFGGDMARLADQIITGEQPYQRSTGLFPVPEKAFSAVSNIVAGIYEGKADIIGKGVAQGFETLGIATGFPVQAAKDYKTMGEGIIKGELEKIGKGVGMRGLFNLPDNFNE